MSRTPITDTHQKIDIIDHLQQDHAEELLLLAQTFTPFSAAQKASIIDIFAEGILIKVWQEKEEEAFIPFQLQGELEEQILYLAYLALYKQGKNPPSKRQQFFTVIQKTMITENILRLELQSPTPLPENSPAYAYWFTLKTLPRLPVKSISDSKKISFFSRLFNRAFLWLMKHLSTARRQKIISKISQGGRYYTLRRAFRSETAEFADRAYVDIFLHGNSAGSQWAKGLKAGDIIYSQAETADKHEHLRTGKALLIADETAYPALIAMLENWQNPLPPIVMILSAAGDEQRYFTNENFPLGGRVLRIIASPEEQKKQVLTLLANFPFIDCAWGACEYELAREIRHFLRRQCRLTGKNNRLKGYWRQKTS